ncbi:MAG TPA: ABC transporter substrate-binding protein [Chloroflexia bacterium]
MTRRIQGRLLTLALLALVLSSIPATGGSSYAQGDSRTFTETGKTVKGKFLAYWNAHGGLAQQGLPISDEMQDVSNLDGKSYTVQYFERAVFELHPENQAPYDVLLSLAGVFRFNQKYPQGAPNQKASTDNPLTFKETGMALGGKFRAYWESHGGLAQQGYPITNEFTEKSELDGKSYTVQYFERAVFELHPENQAPNDVLLSQLGTFQYKEKTDLSFTDWTGAKRTLAKRPQRIVCLTGFCEDALFQLGLEPVAVNDMLYKLPQFWGPNKTFPAIGGSFGAPNLEDIAKQQPDLVIGFQNIAGQRDAIEKIAPLFIINPGKFEDTIDNLRIMSRLTGRNYQGEQAIKKFYAKLNAYRAKSPNNKVPLLLFGNSANFSVFTQASMPGSILTGATYYPWPPEGGPLAPDREPGSLQYSLEKVLQKDPDVLLVITQGSGANGKLSEILAQNPIWSQLKAVKNKQVYEVSFQFYVTGRGLVSLGAALDDAMMKIYPETFTKPLP